MQADAVGGFRDRMRKALESIERAEDAYRKSDDPRRDARVLRCQASAAYLRFWLAATIDERRKELDEAWSSAKAALKAFEDAGDAWGYGTTYNQLSLVPILRFYTEWDARFQEPTLRDAIQFGERAITTLSTLEDPKEFAKAYASTARGIGTLLLYLAENDEKEELHLDPDHEAFILLEAPNAEAVRDYLTQGGYTHFSNLEFHLVTPIEELLK